MPLRIAYRPAFLFVLLLASASASAATPTKIDGRIRGLFAHRAISDAPPPMFRDAQEFMASGAMPVIVRFKKKPTHARMIELSEGGVLWDRDGVPLASGASSADINDRGLATLSKASDVLRVESDLAVIAPSPNVDSAEAIQSQLATRAHMLQNGNLLDGTGIKIADVDSAGFIHHPAFFRADAGVFPWVDVNGDGTLTPGIDGVDLDGDGTISATEVLRTLPSTMYARGLGYPTPTIRDGEGFVPDIDHLYLDVNGNGRRDYGAGFSNDTPAFGEPIFVADDADHDQIVTRKERLLRLGTSKYRAVRADTIVYTRDGSSGKWLNDYNKMTDPLAGHAPGVGGILVGGVNGISRFVGLVPNAELLLADSRNNVRSIQWSIDQKADVVVTEYAPYASVTLDGSSEGELILDAALEKGTVPISPAGNLASGRKHLGRSFSPGRTELILSSMNGESYLGISAHHRSNINVKYTLRDPNGVEHALGEQNETIGTSQFYAYLNDTTKGTHEQHVWIYGTNQPVDIGDYTVIVDVPEGQPPVTIDLYVSDEVHSWSGGIAFQEGTPTRTVCYPATSEKTIAVGAYTLNAGIEYGGALTAGDLAGYSSRGPLIDGRPGIVITAPDNPISANHDAKNPYGVYFMTFGGTSGAGPHVAAVAAMIKQLYPTETGPEIRERIVRSAFRDSFVTNDESVWGQGKVSALAALGLPRPSEGRAPIIRIDAPAAARPGRDVTLKLDIQDDEDKGALRARWDVNYDGTPDTDWLPIGEQVITVGESGSAGIRVEVYDSQGHLSTATAIVNIDPNALDPTTDIAPNTPAESGGCACNTAPTRHASPWSLFAFASAIALFFVRRSQRTRS